jgi:hypothetical protein
MFADIVRNVAAVIQIFATLPTDPTFLTRKLIRLSRLDSRQLTESHLNTSSPSYHV